MSIINQVCWECPSNIALVKYWGKRGRQLPLNASLSFSLRESVSRTRITVSDDNHGFKFLFEGKETAFSERIGRFLETLSERFAWINSYHLTIESENTFPHSAGIASSASAFGALALGIIDLDVLITGQKISDDQFRQKASYLARLGSGSACRSIFSGFALWGYTDMVDSSDEYAIEVVKGIDSSYFSLCDAVLLVDSGQKEVSSSAGHQLINKHPFREGRMAQAASHLKQLLEAMKRKDDELFFRILEGEALSLHALMMTSDPSFLLLKPKSIEIIQKIRNFRQKTGIACGFTIDAGPNIHLIYFEEDKEQIHRFISTELSVFLEDNLWIDDRIGQGPKKIG